MVKNFAVALLDFSLVVDMNATSWLSFSGFLLVSELDVIPVVFVDQ